jgi:glycosyltransferase involved in cell wall biosynthesis
MKVSIVIPCYDERSTIEQIIEAVRKAPVENREIIVVDDCSQDGTQTVLKERLSQVVDRIIYHRDGRHHSRARRRS